MEKYTGLKWEITIGDELINIEVPNEKDAEKLASLVGAINDCELLNVNIRERHFGNTNKTDRFVESIRETMEEVQLNKPPTMVLSELIEELTGKTVDRICYVNDTFQTVYDKRISDEQVVSIWNDPVKITDVVDPTLYAMLKDRKMTESDIGKAYMSMMPASPVDTSEKKI